MQNATFFHAWWSLLQFNIRVSFVCLFCYFCFICCKSRTIITDHQIDMFLSLVTDWYHFQLTTACCLVRKIRVLHVHNVIPPLSILLRAFFKDNKISTVWITSELLGPAMFSCPITLVFQKLFKLITSELRFLKNS